MNLAHHFPPQNQKSVFSNIISCCMHSDSRKSQTARLPVGHGPLSDLDGAELLVVGAGQAEAALLPMTPRAARAEPVRRRGQRGRAGARLVQHRDLHAVGLERLLVHKLVILQVRWRK